MEKSWFLVKNNINLNEICFYVNAINISDVFKEYSQHSYIGLLQSVNQIE